MQGLKVLVTRPEPENTHTCQTLSNLGAVPVPLPMLQIKPLETEQDKRRLHSQLFNLDAYQYVIFVSKNAARIGAELIDECWPMLPVGIHWLGIGKGTTDTLNNLHIPAISSPGHDTETMLAWLKPVKMREQKVLIVRGQGGRPDLASGLESRGAKVDVLELYQRATPTYDAQTFFFLEEPDVIWVTSGEGLSNLTQQVQQHSPNLMNTTLFVPSERVAEHARSKGWARVICAQGADDQSLIAATMQHLG
ncbi:uroporphyrinogen-III synthase [Rhodanobacter aciditrophus]|uniref:Uroporphyrinogen-III synthase n=1 Tax=Rhodanobacter aciditrophus TaxID=1623218 RepID=A0ABW4B6E6_9GAMM